MKLDAETISNMPQVASSISTGNSKRAVFSSAKKSCAISTQAADDHRISSLGEAREAVDHEGAVEGGGIAARPRKNRPRPRSAPTAR